MPELVDLPAVIVAGVRATVTETELAEFFGRAVGEAIAAIPAASLAGPITAVYHRDEGHVFDVTIGFPISADAAISGLDTARRPAGPALREVCLGPYDRLHETYALLEAALADRGLVRTESWERYVVGPGNDPDPAAWRTEVVVPLVSGTAAASRR